MPSTNPASLGTRLRETFGPVLAGLVGGGLSLVLALAVSSSLCRNMAVTYAKFPSLPTPFMAMPIGDLPGGMILGAMFAAGGLLLVGPMAVALVRPKDGWGDLSAGLSAGLVAAGTTYVLGLGWTTTLATTVVPSISDLTFVTNPDTTPEALSERYPDLAVVEAKERGGIMMAKIVSDQASGGATGVWIGVATALLTAGVTGVCGALAAGYLRRRGDARRTALWAYLGMTLPSVITIGVAIVWLLGPALETMLRMDVRISSLSAIGLTLFAIANGVGAVRRQPAILRTATLLGWFVILAQIIQPQIPWLLTLLAALLAGGFFVAKAILPDRSSELLPAAI
jgi:hypothetical protein